MEAVEIYNGIARAIGATKPTEIYCLFWVYDWPACMSKSEWASWAQAITAIVGIILSAGVFILATIFGWKEKSDDRRIEWNKTREFSEELVTQFSATLDSVYKWMRPGSGAQETWLDVLYRLTLLEGQIDQMKALPLHVLAENELHKIFLLQAHARHLISAMKIAGDNLSCSPAENPRVKEESFLVLNKIHLDKYSEAKKAIDEIVENFSSERNIAWLKNKAYCGIR
jgi:hypothetical protein